MIFRQQRTLQKGGYRGYKRLFFTEISKTKNRKRSRGGKIKQPQYRINRKHSKGGKSTANKTQLHSELKKIYKIRNHSSKEKTKESRIQTQSLSRKQWLWQALMVHTGRNTLATRQGKTQPICTSGEGAQVRTIRDQGRRQTGDTEGRASYL